MFQRFLLMFLVVGLTACGAGDTTQANYTVVQPASINPGDAVPSPQADPVLTLSGNIANTNNGEQLVFDMDTLEKLGVIEYTVPDPFLGEDVTYQGILLSSLLEVADSPDSAITLRATALNDYQVDIPFDSFRGHDVIIATKRNGERMPVSDKGPLEIVYPYQLGGFEQDIINSYWVWQLKALEIQ